jgi:hypothetical protein
MRLLDVGAQLQWLVYSHLNCVNAGLVERVQEYPGFVSDLGLLKGGVITVKRPPLYFSKESPAEIELRFTPPPDLERAFAGELDGMVHWLRREVRVREDELRRERRESGQRALGAGVVKKLHPFAEPRTPRENRGRRIPRFKIGGSMSDPAVRAIVEQCNAEQDGFWAEHEAQRRRWVAGERGAVFPYGTYGMRVDHGARVAESPPADAILAAAGAVAGEVDVRSLLEEMRDERRRETAETVTDLRELAAPASESTENDTAPSAKDDGTRAEATAVELESPARSSRREHPRRMVTLRTRRRGKPRTPT